MCVHYLYKASVSAGDEVSAGVGTKPPIVVASGLGVPQVSGRCVYRKQSLQLREKREGRQMREEQSGISFRYEELG